MEGKVGRHWFQYSYPRDDHSALTDMEKSNLGDTEDHLPLMERGDCFGYEIGFRAL